MEDPTTNCEGEWINDCPFPECKCAKKYLKKRQNETYGDFNFLYWIIFLLLWILAMVVTTL